MTCLAFSPKTYSDLSIHMTEKTLRHFWRFRSLFWAFGCLCTMDAAGGTYLVSTTSDTGPGSFRQAILDANANPGLDRIEFVVGTGGVRTITPASLLPAVTDPVVIDATTQPGYANRPLIEINGSNVGLNAGLRLLAGNSVVRGLAINRFSGDGIRIEGPGTNLVQGNFIGTDPLGTTARGNGQEGILIYGSWGNIVGGTNILERNVISGNGDAGVYLLNGGGNSIQGNYVGTSVSGAAALGNGNNGVAIYNSAANRIGGDEAGARNVISGNYGSGIYLFGSGAASNHLSANFIGTTASGNLMLSNTADGLTFSGASRNRVGGTEAQMGNVISGNGKAGIFISGSTASGNLVEGNFIGCNAGGTNRLGNGLSGITIAGAKNNVIGGVLPGARNIISGNREEGIFITTNGSGNTVQGNHLGVDVSGTQP